MNKIEQVARAIWALRREEEDRCDMELEDMGRNHPVWDEARAAIEAMSVPTEGMVGAGDISLPEWVSNYITNEDLSCAFDAMIDAALEGK